MSAKRKHFSITFKKGIVEASQSKNLMVFCKERKLDLRMVRKWRAKYDEGNAKQRKGRQSFWKSSSADGSPSGEQRPWWCSGWSSKHLHLPWPRSWIYPQKSSKHCNTDLTTSEDACHRCRQNVRRECF